MPHPAATPCAPRLSPRGQGTGVGRRIHGAALLCAALLLATPAAAQIIPTGSPAADIALTSALADQRIFLTCTALDAKAHQAALDFWQADLATAVALLTEKGVPPAAITAFTTAARPETLALPPDTPFSEVTDYCHGHDQWFTRWSRRDFTELAVALPKAFQ